MVRDIIDWQLLAHPLLGVEATPLAYALTRK